MIKPFLCFIAISGCHTQSVEVAQENNKSFHPALLHVPSPMDFYKTPWTEEECLQALDSAFSTGCLSMDDYEELKRRKGFSFCTPDGKIIGWTKCPLQKGDNGT